jgi:hypothetical protein
MCEERLKRNGQQKWIVILLKGMINTNCNKRFVVILISQFAMIKIAFFL